MSSRTSKGFVPSRVSNPSRESMGASASLNVRVTAPLVRRRIGHASAAIGRKGGMNRRKVLEWGGVAAGVVLIAFGIATLVLSIAGHNEVRSQLEREAIVGTPDMTPDEIAKGAEEAGLPDSVELPTCSVAGEEIDTGSEAKCFADYMRIHA